jgi:hypothetical protein
MEVLMKTTTIGLLAGLGGLSGVSTACGDFDGINVAVVDNVFGISTWRLSARFSDPEDRLIAVEGISAWPLDLRLEEGTFYQHEQGSDLPPLEQDIARSPSLAFDTFVSIGRLTQDVQDADATQLSNSWTGFGKCRLQGTDIGWSVPPDDNQGAPVFGSVFFAQISRQSGFVDWIQVKLRYISGGTEREALVTWTLPSPCCTHVDLNCDGAIGVVDLIELLDAWGDPCSIADFDHDGTVGITDFLTLLGSWVDDCSADGV